MKKGLVSVFIPSYNYENFLPAAIDSVLAQTYEDWELIIVDDASADSSPAIIERYCRRYPDRIRKVLLEENVGQSEATNIGLNLANGEFVALLASDDVAHPQRLADGVALLRKRPEVAAVFSKVAFIDADGRPLPEGVNVFNRDIHDIRWQLLEGNFICGTSVVARLSAMREIGGYNRTLGYVEDYDLWLRLLDRHELVRVDDVWVDYRLHGANLSLARSTQDIRLGTLYESVTVAVRAMHRWSPDKLHRFAHRPGTDGYRRELSCVQSRLAECCLQLERNFLEQARKPGQPYPAIGVASAYGFVLDALQNDPDNQSARALLDEIYAALGDTGRVGGGKSSRLGELAPAPVAAIATTASAKTPAEREPKPGQEPRDAGISPYVQWTGQFNLSRSEADQYDRLAATGGLNARFHLITLLPPGGEKHLAATLQSLANQLHPKILFTVVATYDAPPGFAGERLRWLRADGPSLAAVNRSLMQEDADWVGLISCGDQLANTALLYLAEAVGRHPHWQAVYTDDDVIEADGALHSPRLKPDLDVTLLRGMPYVDGLALIRWDAFAAAGGFDTELPGVAATYDLLLRMTEQAEPPAMGHVAGPLMHRLNAEAVAPSLLVDVVDRHVARLCGAKAEPGPLAGTARIGYPLENRPFVSIVIPTRDRLPMLSRCLESLFGKTSYEFFEVLVVDHGSTHEETRRFLEGLSGVGEARLRVVRESGPFSPAALMNAGARHAHGSHLLFMHDDVAALHPEWLECLVAHALRPGIGAVGARLLAADGQLQHGGIVLGLSGCADLIGGAALDDPGYLARYALAQEVAAASAACLLVRKEAFEAVSGFDQTAFPVFMADVDFCLRLGDAGWGIVWTPEATLLHDGPLKLAESFRSAPLSPSERTTKWSVEQDRLLQRWLPMLARDPHYNRLHSLQPPAFSLCENPVLIRDPLPWKALPRVLAQPADREGCGHYRISAPLSALSTAGRVQGWDSVKFYTPVEVARIDPDVLILQRPFTDLQLDYLKQTAKYSKALRLFDLDDLITRIPTKSVHAGAFPKDLGDRLKRAAMLCNRLVVSTQPLADAIKSWHEDIRVVPNRLPSLPWTQLAPRRRVGAKPRIGWAGARGHEGDLELVAETVRILADEVDWVFLGYCPEPLRPFVREFHPAVPMTSYPAALAALELDVAVAPLEINAFNEAKSALKILEYGILGYPVVCTDITPYQGDFPVTRVRNQTRSWVEAIRALAHDAERSAAEGNRLREHVVNNWLLDTQLDEWTNAWLR